MLDFIETGVLKYQLCLGAMICKVADTRGRVAGKFTWSKPIQDIDERSDNKCQNKLFVLD